MPVLGAAITAVIAGLAVIVWMVAITFIVQSIKDWRK